MNVLTFDAYAEAGIDIESLSAAKYANSAKVVEAHQFPNAKQSDDDAKIAKQGSIENEPPLAEAPKFSGGLAAGNPLGCSTLAELATLAAAGPLPSKAEAAKASPIRCGLCGAEAGHMAAPVNPASWLCDRCWPSDPVEAAFQATERAALMEKRPADPDAEAHFMPASWDDAMYQPTSGARCRSCGAFSWWGDHAGWRCGTCHPAPPTHPGIERICT